jgi:hypothetical protein
MKKIIFTVATLAATLVLAAPAMAQTPLNMNTAKNRANNYALNNWDASSMLPSYSAATSWDGADRPACNRWSRMRIDCAVSVSATDYFFDPYFGDYSGYAFCVGEVKVTKNRWGGISTTTIDLNPAKDCESTVDF